MTKTLFSMAVGIVAVQLCASPRVHGVAVAQDNEVQIRQLKLQLPIVDSSVCRNVVLAATLAKRPVGVECAARMPGTVPRAREQSRVETMLDLSGLRFGEALNVMFEHTVQSQYEAHSRSGYVVVRRLRMPGEEAVLDRRVPIFVLEGANFVQAAQAVRRIVTPEYVANSERLYGRDRPLAEPAQTEPEVVRKFRERYNAQFSDVRSLRMMNATVEDILIAVAAAYGNYSWTVEYDPGSWRFEDALLQFHAVDKQGVSLAPMKPTQKR